jgi:hypothetical protein
MDFRLGDRAERLKKIEIAAGVGLPDKIGRASCRERV